VPDRLALLMVFLFAALLPASISCGVKQGYMVKVSSLLQRQIELRRQQIADPSDRRLEQMKKDGMILDDIGVQRVFIYMKAQPSLDQQQEMAGLGIKLYPQSWIPPVGNNDSGFFLADLPVNKVEALAALEYIVRLDTAERQSGPHGAGNKPD
jgi:hypothetical protein